MRIFFISLILLVSFHLTLAQDYRPRAGETVMRVSVEGRGNIFIELVTKQAPKTTAHIMDLVKQGFYDGQRFHRVERIPKPYLVQMGDPSSKSGDLNGTGGGSGTHVPYEDSGMDNVKGAVGLAHPVGDRDAGDSQFYMLLDRASFLDNNYTVFGRVVAGMDVLEKIQKGDRVTSVTMVQ